ncbi:MAG: hypothetical protein ACR2OU_20155 [Thermomicrobiales bacterium]
MALTITITDPNLIKLIQQKAEETGVSQSEAAQLVLKQGAPVSKPTQAVHTPLTSEYKAERKAKILATLASIHELVTDEDRAFNFDAWLYDENGLPH